MDLPISPRFRDYFEVRRTLFNQDSEFSYCSSCDARCCTDPTQVTVTAYDIVNICLETDRKPSDFADVVRLTVNVTHSKLGFHKGIYPLGLELPKPCNFLERTKCSVYRGRPLSCVTYPEMQFVNKNETKAISEDHPCKAGMELSEKRIDALTRLHAIRIHEGLADDFFFFGSSPALVNMNNYNTEQHMEAFQELDRIYCEERGLDPGEFGRLKPGPRVDEVRNRFIRRLPAMQVYMSRIREKIKSLETKQGLAVLETASEVTKKVTEEIGFSFGRQYVLQPPSLVASYPIEQWNSPWD